MEALRGRRAHSVGEVVGDRAAPRASPGWRAAGEDGLRRGDRAALRLGRPPGRVRRGRPATPTCPRGAARAARPLVVALDQVQDPQNLGSICRTAECVGGGRRRDPRAPRGRGHAGGVQGLGGRGRAPAVARVRNMADFLGEARGAGCWCYGASARPDAAPVLRRAPTTGGGVVLVLGSEGRAFARAWRRPATS